MATRTGTVRLNATAFDHAKGLIKAKKVVLDQRDDWSEHQPSADEENRFIAPRRARRRSRDATWRTHPRVHRCAVYAAESRAGQYKYDDTKAACAHLHGMMQSLE